MVCTRHPASQHYFFKYDCYLKDFAHGFLQVMASNRMLLASVQKGLLGSFTQQSAAAHLRKTTTLLSRTTELGSEKLGWTQAACYSTASPATRPAQNTGPPQVQLNSVGTQWEANFAAQPAQAAFPNAAFPNVAYTDSLLRVSASTAPFSSWDTFNCSHCVLLFPC